MILKKDLAARDSNLKDLCKKDSILSTWSERELNALKPYSEILYKLLTLETKASYSISRLCDNNSLLYNSSNNKILESSNCHVELERSKREISNIDLRRDISTLSQYDKSLDSSQNALQSPATTQVVRNLETNHCHVERSETSKILESKNHNPNLTQILESTNLTKNTESTNHIKEAFSLYFHNISHDEFQALQDLALDLKPWRKGPFCLYSAEGNTQFYIDSEWQSNKKMKLILKALDTIGYSLKDKVVLDVGCNNGYYMFDLALRGVKHISGIDPIAIFFLQFYFIHKLANISYCAFRLLGVQDVITLNAKYDLILCLGVLYHRKEPLQTLKQLKSILAPNGIVLLETLILQDSNATCLCPYPNYAKMPNVFYIFSPQALQNLALHAGFKSCEILSYSYTDNTEQRSTDFIDKKSLGDYLSPTQTIEGYPPACRGIFVLS